MKIGIPRALIYWKRPYFWENFFEGLGFEVLLSPKTNKEIVEMGVKASDPETCFSVKVFFGHLLWLEGKADYIFVPRLKTNGEKLEYCPKFFGLPDLAKILIQPVKSSLSEVFAEGEQFKRVNTRVLTATFDERKERYFRTLEKLGEKLGKGKGEVKKAAEVAEQKERELEEKKNKNFFEKIGSKKPKIVLISHPYNLQDEYVNLCLGEKLEKLGAEPIFIDEIPLNSRMSVNIEAGPAKNREIRGQGQVHENSQVPNFHWEFGKEIMEKIDKILQYDISGAVEVSSFACGCDAVLKEFVEKEFKRNKIPFLYLIIDEQAGEAGFQTRIEAFIDTLLAINT